jgi:hypothetical protein
MADAAVTIHACSASKSSQISVFDWRAVTAQAMTRTTLNSAGTPERESFSARHKQQARLGDSAKQNSSFRGTL